MPDALNAALLIVAGFGAGYVNAIAGAGSLITLPVLIFTGLTAAEANATNRIAILLQNIGALIAFKRGGLKVERAIWWLTIPTTLAAIGGAYFATQLSEVHLRIVIAAAMIAFLVLSLLPPKKMVTRDSAESEPPIHFRPSMLVWFPLIGLYAGFLQAGVGILILLYLSLAYGISLVAGNMAKVAMVLVLTLGALAVFVATGTRIDWLRGAVMGVATLLGGYWGARAALRKGERLIRAGVVLAILASAAKLIWDTFA